MVKKVLVFGDIGIDDTMALIYSFYNDNIDVVGVVADYGNVTRETAIASIRYIKSLLKSEKAERVTIIGGAKLSLTGVLPEAFPEIHGEYGLGPIVPTGLFDDINTVENFFEIVNIINNNDDLVILNIGRLTSLATMFILYPALMKKIKGYYIMGGAFWVPGNVTPLSEANFYEDPIATNIVITHAENLTIVPMNVTQQAIVTPEMVDYIDKNQSLDIIKPMVDYYYEFYKKRTPDIIGSPLHDVLAMMAIEEEQMLTYYVLPVQIVQTLGGIEQGQSVADIRPYVNLDNEQDNKVKKHRIAFELDYEKFFIKFMSVMTGQRFD